MCTHIYFVGLLGRNAFSGLLGGLRRVGSAHNLSPLGPATHTARSLPPSPHHTPRFICGLLFQI